MQAKRLVKSSIIAVESTEQVVDDEDFYQDPAEVTDFVNAHRGEEVLPEEGTAQQGEARGLHMQDLKAMSAHTCDDVC